MPSSTTETAPSPSASLDPTESTQPWFDHSSFDPLAPDRDVLLSAFRHRGWHADRIRIFWALTEAGASRSRVASFASCGTGHWLLRSKTDPDRYRFVLDSCHDRLCRPCAAHRAAIIQANLAAHLPDHPVRMITLTMAAEKTSLGEQIDSLYASFRLLRKRAFWKDRVYGGVAFLEVTWNPERATWHPHLHVLVHGKFFPQAVLAGLWLHVTGNSRIVDIRLIPNTHAVVHYVTKYVTKPIPQAVVLDHLRLTEAVASLAHRKTVLAFGTWAKWRLLHDPSDDDWDLLGHVNQFLYGRDLDEHFAAAVRQAYALFARSTEYAVWSYQPPPDERSDDDD